MWIRGAAKWLIDAILTAALITSCVVTGKALEAIGVFPTVIEHQIKEN